MAETKVKKIFNYVDEGVNKTKVIFSDTEKDTEIIFEGNGKIKAAIEV